MFYVNYLITSMHVLKFNSVRINVSCGIMQGWALNAVGSKSCKTTINLDLLLDAGCGLN